MAKLLSLIAASLVMSVSLGVNASGSDVDVLRAAEDRLANLNDHCKNPNFRAKNPDLCPSTKKPKGEDMNGSLNDSDGPSGSSSSHAKSDCSNKAYWEGHQKECPDEFSSYQKGGDMNVDSLDDPKPHKPSSKKKAYGGGDDSFDGPPSKKKYAGGGDDGFDGGSNSSSSYDDTPHGGNKYNKGY